MWSHVAVFSYAIKLHVLEIPAIYTLCENILPDACTVFTFFFYGLLCTLVLVFYRRVRLLRLAVLRDLVVWGGGEVQFLLGLEQWLDYRGVELMRERGGINTPGIPLYIEILLVILSCVCSLLLVQPPFLLGLFPHLYPPFCEQINTLTSYQ